MWISDGWQDFELIDCSAGEKLERWEKYHLVRPDPQAIWTPERRDPHWLHPDAQYSRSGTGGGYWKNYNLPQSWQIGYKKLVFNVKPMAFKHTGIFPEQATNWDFVAKRTKDRLAAGKSMNILNLFAYTGAATISAAAAGAHVCHVDAARGMISWARENAQSSGVAANPIRWIVDDCAGFVEREIRRGKRYDAIIMDPPSYGRGPNGQIWKIENDLYKFVELCSGALSDDPDFVLISSYSTGLAPSVLGYILGLTVGSKYGGNAECRELGLPVTSSSYPLPCGASARWTRE